MHDTNTVGREKVRREFEVQLPNSASESNINRKPVQEVGWTYVQSIWLAGLVMDLYSSLHRVSSALGVLIDVVQS